ncbi:MAG: hypothetical protein V4625_12900 [Pseudomonadota bacterium]
MLQRRFYTADFAAYITLERMVNRLSLGCTVLSVLLYLGALALPGFYVVQGTEGAKPWIEGFWLLVFGPLALFQGLVAWLANPCLFVAWFLFFKKSYVKSFVLSLVGLGFASSFLLSQGARFHDGSGMNTIGRNALGYWLWVASLAVASISAVLAVNQRSE